MGWPDLEDKESTHSLSIENIGHLSNGKILQMADATGNVLGYTESRDRKSAKLRRT